MKKNVIDINESTIKKFVESMRPEDIEIREEVDIGYSYSNSVIEIFEIRKDWMNPKEKLKMPFVRIKYVNSKSLWKLYWIRASGKWESYKPFPSSTHLSKIIEVIDKDESGCFKG